MDNKFLTTVLTLLVMIELLNLLVTIFYQRRSTQAYEIVSEIQKRIFFLKIKHERDESIRKELPGGAYAWLARQVKDEYGISVEFDESDSIKLESTPVLVARTSEGDSLVISPFSRTTLRKRLHGLIRTRGRLAKLSEESTVLNLLKKAKQERFRSLETAGEFFDIEAQKVDEELKVGWGATDILHLSWVKA